MSFDKSLEFTLKWEGGETYDTGGHTKYGISKNAFPHLDIKKLTLEDAKKIYYTHYWKPTAADKMQWPLCLVAFDTAVNMGVSKALRMYADVIEQNPDYLTREVANEMIADREAFYRTLAKRSKYKKYLRGWLNRINDLRRVVNG